MIHRRHLAVSQSARILSGNMHRTGMVLRTGIGDYK